MLLSISLILIVGMFMGWLCQKCRLPSLLGMLATGMVLGPYVLNLLDGSILGISPELRKIALIIILTRAGLGLDTSGLKKLGRPTIRCSWPDFCCWRSMRWSVSASTIWAPYWTCSRIAAQTAFSQAASVSSGFSLA